MQSSPFDRDTSGMNRSSSTAERLYGEAVAALNRRHWPRAWDIAQTMLGRFGEHPGVHFVAGVAALESRNVRAARAHLQRAVDMNGMRADYRAYLAKAMVLSSDFKAAGAMADAAMELRPDDALLLDTLGVVYSEAGRHESASEAFQRAVERAPERANARFNLATALLYSGDIDRAEQEYQACIERDARQWKAYTALSSLRRQTSRQNHVQWLQETLQRYPGDAGAAAYLNLALAKEHEDLEQYPQAFDHYVRGKAAAGSGVPRYSPEEEEALFRSIADAFPAPPATGGHDSEEPIFVMGLPRSGTTLVDRILGSHPQVTSAGELHQFPMAVKRASGSRTPLPLDRDTLARTGDIDWKALGQAYIDSTRPLSGATARFVDKLPHNFLYLGHIMHALPGAKLILMRRDPMDSCLSNLRQLFSIGSPFTRYSFDLQDIGHYYLQFDRLVQHWMRVFPGRILEVSYEELVAEQKAVTARLLQHCGLEWDEACLHFERNAAPTATASVVQVREPMQRQYLGRWRRYGNRLDTLRSYLEEHGVRTD